MHGWSISIKHPSGICDDNITIVDHNFGGLSGLLRSLKATVTAMVPPIPQSLFLLGLGQRRGPAAHNEKHGFC